MDFREESCHQPTIVGMETVGLICSLSVSQSALSLVYCYRQVAVLGKNIWGGGLAPNHLGGNNG